MFDSDNNTVAAAYSPPVAMPCRMLTATRITAAHAPTARSAGASARTTDPADIIVTAATSARCLPRVSANRPKNEEPRGANNESQGEEPVDVDQRIRRVGIEVLGTEVRSEGGVEVEVEPLHEIGHRPHQDDPHLSATIRMRPGSGRRGRNHSTTYQTCGARRSWVSGIRERLSPVIALFWRCLDIPTAHVPSDAHATS